MKRLFAVAVIAIALAPALAFAKTFPIPDEDPIATVSVPDAWESSPYDGGVESTSPDGKIYVAIESVKAADVKTATTEGIEWFAKQGVEIDADSMKTKEIKINDLTAFDLEFSGKDKDGAANISLTLVGTNAAGKFLMLYYWGSADGEKANADDLAKIAASIQATK